MINLRDKIKNRLSVGTWMQIGSTAFAEILSESFEWVCVDLEHGMIDIEHLADIFRVLNGNDVGRIARLPYNDPIWIHRVLDAGADGIIVPMVNNKIEANNVVTHAKYPPIGERGFGYSLANRHGLNFYEYIRKANDHIAIIVQIEHVNAIENLEEILAVEHVDGSIIGPFDLSGSMGICGEIDHPKMINALHRYLDVSKSVGKPAGIHIVNPTQDNVNKYIKEGYTFIALGMDNIFLRLGMQQSVNFVKQNIV